MASLVPRPTFGSSGWITTNAIRLGTRLCHGEEEWFHSHVLVTVGCAAGYTALSGGLSSKVLGKMTYASCHAGGKNPLHVTLVTCNRLNGPSKVLTATDGQQIKLTANYFSRFNHVIGKLPGHGHGRPSKTVK